MKLSYLVSYLNHLDRYDITGAHTVLTGHLDPVLHAVSTHDLQFPDITERLHSHRDRMTGCLQDYAQAIDDLKHEIRRNIELLEPHYLQESYKLYSENMVNDTNEHMLNRRPTLQADSVAYLRARLMRHSDWHYPGMILRPGLEEWIQDLVALDPMYLVDVNHDMLLPCVAQFTPEYQARVRRYVIQESADVPMFDRLPQAQMSLVLAYNYFNFKPLELVRCFLREIYGVLRPGGTLMFTFNNCDRSGGVDLAERYFMCYTPGRLVLSAAELLGFRVAHTYDIDAAATWVELQKPGTLSSNRGGQALAKIVAKSAKTQ
jgi:SAM-dependent methyltransferase